MLVSIIMKRSYTMRSRAEAAEATRRRILESAAGLLKARLRSDIRLEDIARDAGVSVPTVLRAFGSRARLLDLALEETLRVMRDALHRPDPGDVAGSVSAWFDHYEEFGDVVVHNLAADFDPEKYTDEYRANLMKIIRAKMSGKKIKGVRTASAATHDDKVIDLMARLRESLAEGKKKPARTARARKKTTTRRKKSA